MPIIGDLSMEGYNESATKYNSLCDSGRTDSGFLSSANLSSEHILSEEIVSKCLDSGVHDSFQSSEPEVHSKQFMRLDSGIDISLSEDISKLNLDSCITETNVILKPTKANCVLPNISKDKSFQQLDRTVRHESDKFVQQRFGNEPWEYFQQDSDGDTQLHIAIVHGFIEVVYSLIQMVPDPRCLDIMNNNRQTPLHLAVLTKQARIVRLLLLAGAKCNMKDCHGFTALHSASQVGDVECFKALTQPISVAEISKVTLQYDPFIQPLSYDLEDWNYEGQTCLHIATVAGHVDIVRELFWFGGDVNAKEGKSGRTVVHLAVEFGQDKVLEFLVPYCLNGGLQLQTTNYAGLTACQVARKMNSPMAAQLQQYSLESEEVSDSDFDSCFDDDSEEEDDRMQCPSNNAGMKHELSEPTWMGW